MPILPLLPVSRRRPRVILPAKGVGGSVTFQAAAASVGFLAPAPTPSGAGTLTASAVASFLAAPRAAPSGSTTYTASAALSGLEGSAAAFRGASVQNAGPVSVAMAAPAPVFTSTSTVAFNALAVGANLRPAQPALTGTTTFTARVALGGSGAAAPAFTAAAVFVTAAVSTGWTARPVEAYSVPTFTVAGAGWLVAQPVFVLPAPKVPDAYFTLTTQATGSFSLTTQATGSFLLGDNMAPQALSLPIGQHRIWQASYATPTNISGYNFAFTVRDFSGKLLVQVTTQSGGIVATDLVNGVLQITLTDSLTVLLTPQSANWDLWRTDAGSEDQLAYGTLLLTPSYLTTPP